jgi:hypothetical protein
MRPHAYGLSQANSQCGTYSMTDERVAAGLCNRKRVPSESRQGNVEVYQSILMPLTSSSPRISKEKKSEIERRSIMFAKPCQRPRKWPPWGPPPPVSDVCRMGAEVHASSLLPTEITAGLGRERGGDNLPGGLCRANERAKEGGGVMSWRVQSPFDYVTWEMPGRDGVRGLGSSSL